MDDFYKYLYAIGPFNHLGSSIIQQIVNKSYEKQLLRLSYLPLLLHENLVQLDLSQCNSLVNDQVLKFLCVRCKKLTQLNLNGCSRLSSKSLGESLSKLSALRGLHLSACRGCSDIVVEKVVRHCPSMQRLTVKSCPRVSDAGIQAIVSHGCNLIYLNVSATSVTMKSFKPILTQLTKLRKLCFSDIKCNEESCIGLKELPSLKLEILDISGTYLSQSDVEYLVDCSPNLVELKFNRGDDMNKCISHHLMSLKHLKSLHLAGTYQDLSFDDVVTFLKTRGGQLESLDLSTVSNVQISAICLHCDSLKELVVADCVQINPFLPVFADLTEEQKKNVAKGSNGNSFGDYCHELQCLNVSFSTFHVNGPFELYTSSLSGLLCGHQNLKKLLVKNVSIDDVVLAKLCDSSSRLVLHTLDLSGCNEITVESVNNIITSCRGLRVLDLSHCKEIGQEWVLQWRKILKKAANPLRIIWI